MTSPTRPLLAALAACLLLLTGSANALGAVNGPDVSSYQHPGGSGISWGSAHASGNASFGFVKATEGTGYTNPYFASDFAGMKAAGMVRGAYHFASPNLSAVTQAQSFVRTAGTLGSAGDLPPVLDLETTGGLSPSALIAWTQSYVQTIKTLTGRTAMIYTGPYFWQTAMANTTAFSGYPLWIASYGAAPQLPGGWRAYTFWQYTSSASVPGISGAVDMSVFNGTVASLQALANGAAPAPAPPFGSFDSATWNGSSLVASGWTIDPATSAAISVSVSVDGVARQTGTANAARSDVGSAYPAYGANHGYTVAVPAIAGSHSVCVTALGTGSLTRALGCRTAVVPLTPPYGTLDAATWDGTALTVGGWAIDPATAAPIDVSVSLDGTAVRTGTAGSTRTDVAAVHPAFGPAHGYDVPVAASPGAHTVCVTALGSGARTTQLGCRAVTVAASPPFGSVDAATWTGTDLTVQGWAISPNTAGPISVSVSVDGGATRSATASTLRPGVGDAYPASGPNHGFSVALPASPGTHSVCASAIGTLTAQVGCRTVTVTPSPPFGTLDTATWVGTSLAVTGWAIDPATADPVNVSVAVDGTAVRGGRADTSRPDVGAAQPAFGPTHGYTVPLPAAPGNHQVCVTAINVAATLTKQLGCRTVAVPVAPPFGSLDTATWTGSSLAVSGWAISPATAQPINVTVSLDGATVKGGTADTPRSDLGRLFPASGPDHGFGVAVPAAPGPHVVCVTGLGTGTRQLGCRTVTVPASRPIGSLDSVSWNGSAVSASGWALDPDTAAPITVTVSVDGATPQTTTANASRADIGHAFPAYGPNHGWSATAPAAPGPHQVCATAVNTGAGTTNTTLGCRTLTVPASKPVGSLDTVSWNGSAVSASGWALDPDTVAPITVTLSVDGATPQTTTADRSRPDIVHAFPAYGPNHGWSATAPAAPGPHQVCATAVNTGAGTTNTTLGCRTLTVPASRPVGVLDNVTVNGSTVSASGWALDPDTAAPITVTLTVDGATPQTTTADRSRPDIALAFPTYGPNHGFTTTVPAARGRHQVCATAVNTGAGTLNTAIGCRTVTAP